MDVMDYALYRNDISHIILDNLQFMMLRGDKGTPSSNSFERFDSQDALIEKFRAYATEKNVNIILVVHPRKVDDDVPLSLSSISGTAKATQEADAVLILQRLNGKMSLDIKKNRFDGEVGRIPLAFSPILASYYESEEEKKK